MYNLIYADPAWDFDNKRTGGSMSSGASQKYTTTMIERMCALNVQNVCAKDAVLGMWWVGAMPDEALALVRAWGFEIVTMTGFVWVKTTKHGKLHFGMGSWTRAGAECMLIAKRGKPKRMSASIRSVTYEAQVGEHSAKPNIFRKALVNLVGDVPRLEMFAREQREGFDVWGDQIASHPDIVAALAEPRLDQQTLL